jgi:hypothetical protein
MGDDGLLGELEVLEDVWLEDLLHSCSLCYFAIQRHAFGMRKESRFILMEKTL